MYLFSIKYVKKNPIADKFYEEKINQAKGIMTSFIMRRLKTEVLKDLPEKKCEIVMCEMTRRQRDEYDILLNSYKQLKSDYLNKHIEKKSSTAKDNTKKVSSMSVLAALTELRVGFFKNFQFKKLTLHSIHSTHILLITLI